jgi:hypothetical protein
MTHARLSTRPSIEAIRVSFAANPGFIGTQPASEDHAALQNKYSPFAAPATSRDSGWQRDNTTTAAGATCRMRDQTSRLGRPIACGEAFDRSNNLDLEGRIPAVATRSRPVERSRGGPTASIEYCALLHAAI